MKHKDFVRAIAQDTGIPAKEVDSLLQLSTEAIADILSQGDSLSIQYFGTFEVKKKEERLSVNPVSGKRFMVPPKLVPVFRPGVTLKDKIRKYEGHE